MNILEKLEELERRIIPGKWESIDVLSGLLSVVTDKGPEIIHNQIHDDFICLCRNNIKALIECARALDFYAVRDLYNRDEHLPGPLEYDRGLRAREALAKLEGEK